MTDEDLAEIEEHIRSEASSDGYGGTFTRKRCSVTGFCGDGPGRTGRGKRGESFPYAATAIRVKIDRGKQSEGPTMTTKKSRSKARRKALVAVGVDAFERAAKEIYLPSLLEEHMPKADAKKTTEAALIIWREVSAKVQEENRRRRRRKRQH